MPNRLLGKLVICFGLILAFAQGSMAQDYVGVLPEMLKPEVAEKLALTDEQRAQIEELMRKRVSAAIGLGQSIREAPVSQHDQMRADFNAESERLGFALLDADQQRELAKYRVEWLGMLSLADEEVAEALNLADWQKATVAEWVERVRSNRRGPTAERTRSEAERAIRQELSESQWAAWQVAAGKIESSTAGPPMPPELAPPVESAVAQDPQPSSQPDPSSSQGDLANALKPVEQVTLEMNFNGTPWNDVIEWLAEEADLSLQKDVSVPGSFTYRDRSRDYTLTEALDTINASLLNDGYTLFRQGRMLRVIDFESDQEVSGELIAELADYVDEEELARRGKYEPVKHMFTLQRLDPDEIYEEAEQLRSMQGTVRSLPASRQLLVSDMAGNVRAIGEMIRRAEGSGSSAVQVFPLKSINAEEVLAVARPLLGLESEVNVSDEIRISTDAFGSKIYASGKPDKIQILKDLAISMDVPPSEDESLVGERETLGLKRHKVVGIDMQLAYEVVSQLLAGSPDVRLAQDAVAKQLVLYARPSEHQLVQDTLNELAGETSDFQVVQLTRLDPTLAIAAIKKFFSLPDTADADSGAPVIDGDLLARQVWVKGSATQVQQIKTFIEDLEANAKSSDILPDTIRIIPLTGSSARQTLDQVQQLWGAHNQGQNPIRILTPSTAGQRSGGLEQKSFAPRSEAAGLRPGLGGPRGPQARQPAAPDSSLEGAVEEATTAEPAGSSGSGSQEQPEITYLPGQTSMPGGKLTAFPQQEPSASDRPAGGAAASGEGLSLRKSGDIVIMEGPSGLIIQSDDKEALAEFDSLMRLLADQAAFSSGEPTVVYLKNRKAAAAKELLETILSGTSSSGDSGGGLLGDMASSVLGGFGGGMFGSMLGGGGDTLSSGVGIATGDYTITADPWLNALVIKAGPADMSLIEQLLTVIDQAEGPLAIETQGQLAMIEVVSQEVTQVLSMIKELYGDRIVGSSSGGGSSRGGGGGSGGGGGGQPNPAEIIAALRGGGGRTGRGGAASELTEPKISISADTNTNMLIVMAQPKQIQELRDLVAEIDRVGELEQEDFGYSSLGGIVSASVFQDSIGRILGPKAQTNATSSSSNSSSSSSGGGGGGGGGPSDDDAAAQARRQAFFDAIRQRGGFGGGAPSGGGTPGGGSGFGGRGGGTPGSFGGFGGRGGDSGGRRGGN